MLMQGVIDLVILVEGEVGTNARPVGPGVDPITDEIDDRLIRLISLPVPQDRKRATRHWITLFPRLNVGFRRLLELDRGETPGICDTLVPAAVSPLCSETLWGKAGQADERPWAANPLFGEPTVERMLTVELRQAKALLVHDPMATPPEEIARLRTAQLKAQPVQLLGVALPLFENLDPQIEVDRSSEQGLDLVPRCGADFTQPAATMTDHNALL